MMDTKPIIEGIGTGFELIGVLVLVIGAAVACVSYLAALLRREKGPSTYRQFRRGLGKAILIGLELLVAADIIRSVAIAPSFESVGVLGLLVLVRTFLSWSLEVEINGEWPWQRFRSHKDRPPDPDEL
jgi:uncharacterized membrane protein